VAEEQQPGEILRRAVAYPYEAPLRSFVQVGTRTLDWPDERDPDLLGRPAILAYGSNASPAVLIRKLAGLPEEPLPVAYGELFGFDVVYSAHISPHGTVPATLQRSPGTVVAVHVLYPTEAQLKAISATEPNYELDEVPEVELYLERGEDPFRLFAYLSLHGCLRVDDREVALAAVEATGRDFPAMGEVEVLEHVRHLLAPELDLERFVESSLDPGMAAARTTVLRGNAIPLRES